MVPAQMTLLSQNPHRQWEALEELDPDSLSPRQALEWLYRLKNMGSTYQ
jgi:DNA mismatch repair protein MutS